MFKTKKSYSISVQIIEKLSARGFQLAANFKMQKGNGTSVAVLHLYDSFHQKCSKFGTYTTQGLKNNFYFRGFSISSGPEPCISDEYRQFFSIFNKVSKVPQP
jgi:hypothetical protein